VAALRQRIINRVRPADLDQIVDGLVTKAKAGDFAATKLLLGYLVGKPAGVVNPDTLEMEEWQLRAKAPSADEQSQVMTRSPFDLANVMAGTMEEVQWAKANRQIDEAQVRWAAQDTKAPTRYSPRSIHANRMTAAFAQPKNRKKAKRKAKSIFQRMKGKPPAGNAGQAREQ
jgi:hypothetical protein